MKKLTQVADLGGAPITKADLRSIFGIELWDVIEGIISKQGDCVLSGCVTTANGGGFDMTAGICFISGEFMRIPAATAQTFTKYIGADTVVDDTRTFADGTSHVVASTKPAKLQAGVTTLVISSLTSLDASRFGDRDANWLSYTLVNTDIVKEDGTTSPTSISATPKVWYRRANKETHFNVSFTCTFAAAPLAVAIKRASLPAALKNAIEADPNSCECIGYGRDGTGAHRFARVSIVTVGGTPVLLFGDITDAAYANTVVTLNARFTAQG